MQCSFAWHPVVEPGEGCVPPLPAASQARKPSPGLARGSFPITSHLSKATGSEDLMPNLIERLNI